MMLCDFAAVAEGKLYIAGGGWSIIGPGVGPTGVAILVGVPWDQTNHPHQLKLILEREDGEAVQRVDEFGQSQPIAVDAEFELGRPAGLARGTNLDMPLALNFPPLPLERGQRYRWVLYIDGERGDDWVLPFAVRRAASSEHQG